MKYLLILLTLLSGCMVSKGDIERATKLCSCYGGLRYINRSGMFGEWIEVVCKDGTIFSYMPQYVEPCENKSE